MADQVKTTMTAEEFFELPETNLPRQLLNGELVEATVPELDHQDVVGNIFVLFKQIVKTLGGKAYVAPVDVYFDPLNIPQPDVLWVAPRQQMSIGGHEKFSWRARFDCRGAIAQYGTVRQARKVSFVREVRCARVLDC